MHIPDGFLDTKTCLSLGILSGAMLSVALKKSQSELSEQQVPLMGVTAAFLFAAQLLNFPVGAGTSGHLVGSALVGILLGPWAGLLVMTTILALQAFLFQDGGVLTLGANIFNMGIVGIWTGAYTYKVFVKLFNKKGKAIGAFIGGWIATVLSALACSLELGLSGTVPLRAALLGMGSVHLIIGIPEGLITVAVLKTVQLGRREMLESSR